MKKKTITAIMDDIVRMMTSCGVQSINLKNEDGEGVELPIHFPKGDEYEDLHFCIDVLYSSLNADDCLFRAWHLPSVIKDLKIWEALQSIVRDELGF